MPTSTLPPQLLDLLRAELRADQIAHSPEQMLVYECDGQTLSRAIPDVVVYPETTADIQAAVRACAATGTPFLARGAGTGLSGGAVAARNGLIIEMARMNCVLAIDADNRTATVQPGLVNLHLSRATHPLGLHFAPDPSSQSACTVGGNVAENSGGPHTLKYGVTTNHILSLLVVLPDGTLLRTCCDDAGYDLTGLFVGSEGTFGIATEIVVRLVPNPEAVRTLLAVFTTIDDASATVAGVIRAGVVPAAMELMDQLAIEAVERHIRAGFPTDAAAVLLIEIDGAAIELDDQAARIEAICRDNHARDVQHATDEATRAKLWKGRKQALGAMGKIAKAYYTHDGVVPPDRLPDALRGIADIARRHELRVANVCHAGDGNLHPLILYDPDNAAEVQRVHDAGSEILRLCVDLGGTLTGEHGIGVEKQDCMPWLFSDDDLDHMRRVRDVFDPQQICNPAKVFPTGAKCGEVRTARVLKTGGWL
ncbi:MAG: FAD-binding oxidoreductase [Planctomycetota bacterium]